MYTETCSVGKGKETTMGLPGLWILERMYEMVCEVGD